MFEYASIRLLFNPIDIYQSPAASDLQSRIRATRQACSSCRPDKHRCRSTASRGVNIGNCGLELLAYHLRLCPGTISGSLSSGFWGQAQLPSIKAYYLSKPRFLQVSGTFRKSILLTMQDATKFAVSVLLFSFL